jgi:predicted ATPase
MWLGSVATAFGLHHPESEAMIKEAFEVVQETDERWYEPELYRLRGHILISARDEEHAEGSFLTATRIASAQETKLLELRASTDLARLWRDQGKRTEARDVLAPIYGWFTEGFDTSDLKEAKALLEELG